MPKFRVKFEMVTTSHAFVEAETEEAAKALAMDLFGLNDSFVDYLLGNGEGETCDLRSCVEVDEDSVLYRYLECWTEYDLEHLR